MWVGSVLGVFYLYPFGDFLFPGRSHIAVITVVSFLILFGIPLFGLIALVSRVFFGRRNRRKLALFLGILWMLNLIGMSFTAMTIAKEFQAEQNLNEEITLDNNAETLNIALSGIDYEPTHLSFQDKVWISESGLVYDLVGLSIRKSESDRFELFKETYSRGSSRNEAEVIAQSIECKVSVNEDGVLILPSEIIIPNGKKWRGQEVRLILKVPVGKSIKLDGDFHPILRNVDLEDKQVHPWRYSNKVWTMGPEGLVCFTCYDEDDHKKRFSFDNFSNVKIEGNIKATVKQTANYYSIRLSGTPSRMDQVDISKNGEMLLITSNLNNSSSPVRLVVNMPQLNTFVAQNTDDIYLDGFEQAKLLIENRGDQQLKANVSIDSLFVMQVGNNEVDLRGKSQYLIADISESANLDADKIEVKIATVKAAQNSRARLKVSDTLYKTQDESSSVSTEGDAKVVEQ